MPKRTFQAPSPRALYTPTEHILNTSLRSAFEAEDLDLQVIENFLSFAELEGVALDSATLEMAVRKRMERPAELDLMKERILFLPLFAKGDREPVRQFGLAVFFVISTDTGSSRHFEGGASLDSWTHIKSHAYSISNISSPIEP